MDVTAEITRRTSRLAPVPEITSYPPGYRMFNAGSVEIEVAEFLYSLVRLVKPDRILETGTHAGVSAAYMGEALKANERGTITTLEWDGVWCKEARALIYELGLQSYVGCHQGSSLEYITQEAFDIIFLDSEPQIRFDEFVRFWPNLKPGGFIMIHDLHPHLGHTDTIVDGMYDWPYGDFRSKLGPMIKNHEIQTVNFRNPRGFTLFQRAAADFGAFKLLKGEI